MKKFLATIAAISANSIPRQNVTTIASNESLDYKFIAPASFGSLGDEAMFTSISQNLFQNNKSFSFVAPLSSEQQKTSRNGIVDLRLAETANGFLTDTKKLPSSMNTVVIGADSFDGAYGIRSVSSRISLLNKSVMGDGKAYLANFSLTEKRPKLIDTLLKTLNTEVQIYARDYRSAERASEIFNKEIIAIPDIAFRLAPQKNVRSKVGSDKLTICLVVNGHLEGIIFNSYKEQLEYFTSLGKALTGLCETLIIMPHDLRPNPGDPLIAKLVQSLVGGNSELFIPQNAIEAKQTISQVDLCVSSRMHASVSALSSGVPCIGLGYLDKFEGQFAWYNQEHMVLRISKKSNSQILELVNESITSFDKISNELKLRNNELLNLPVPWLD